MSKVYNWEQIDQLAAEWYALPKEGNEAVKKSMEQSLFCALMDILERTNLRFYTEDHSVISAVDAIGDFVSKDFGLFDPNQSPFSKFFQSRIKYRALDLYRADKGIRKKKTEEGTVTVSDASLDNEENLAAAQNIPDERAKRPDEDVVLEEWAYEWLALILKLKEYLPGKQNNPSKRLYYRLFFTDDVVNYIRSNTGKVFFKHEQDLFRAMRRPFMNFFLMERCQMVSEIWQSRVKLYGELVKGREMKPVEQPLKNDVYSTYLANVENRKAGSAAISQQRTAYREFIKEKLCLHNIR